MRNECPEWDSNPGKTCHDVTSLRLCHCAGPVRVRVKVRVRVRKV